MRAQRQERPAQGRPIRLRVAAAMAVAVAVLAACTGENLFTGPTTGASSLASTTAEITAPAEGDTIAVGDSVQVTAHVASDNGITQVTFGGVFDGGTTAFISQVVALTSADTTISRFLKQAGTTTGGAKVIVLAQDLLGSQAADTVAVTIGP